MKTQVTFVGINVNSNDKNYGKEINIIIEDSSKSNIKFTEDDEPCEVYNINGKYAVNIFEFTKIIGDFNECRLIMERIKKNKTEKLRFSNVIWKDNHLQYDDIPGVPGIDMDETDLIANGYVWTSSHENLKVFESRKDMDIYISSNEIIPKLNTIIYIPKEQIDLGIFSKIINTIKDSISFANLLIRG